jgi:sugar phosphate isomerase/epimerase
MPPRLAYGTNVAPQEDLAGIVASFGGLWDDVRRRARPDGGRLGLGLWLPETAAREASRDAEAMRRVRAALDGNRLDLVTVNAFPQSAFHAPVVKQAVYRPDWTEPARFAYTSCVARAVAGIVASGSDVTISTLPLGWPKLPTDAWLRAAGLLFAAVLDLARLRDATGTTIRLALEPEPCCAVETTAEAIVFFEQAMQPHLASVARTAGMTESAAAEHLARHLGVCLDLCHAAVEHEDPVASFRRLRAAGVPVFKVQVSAAVAVPDPSDAAQRAALAAFAEPRWLHQVGALTPSGVRVVRDLPDALADADLAASAPWRVHFHVPLSQDRVGGLPTTRPEVARFLASLADDPDPPVLEIETYTWSAVPGAAGDLAGNVAAEIAWTAERCGVTSGDS